MVFRVKQRVAHAVKRKTAPRAKLRFGFAAVAVDDAADAFGGNVFGVVHHFNADKTTVAAVFAVEV